MPKIGLKDSFTAPPNILLETGFARFFFSSLEVALCCNPCYDISQPGVIKKIKNPDGEGGGSGRGGKVMARGSRRMGARADKGEGVLPVKGEGARKDPTRINVFKIK